MTEGPFNQLTSELRVTQEISAEMVDVMNQIHNLFREHGFRTIDSLIILKFMSGVGLCALRDRLDHPVLDQLAKDTADTTAVLFDLKRKMMEETN